MSYKQMGRNKRDRHMIYQIDNLNVQVATEQGAIIICWSTDGTYTLVSATALSEISIINQFNEDELHTLLKLPLWQQPCPAC
jgi:hypothetical protein